MMGIIYEPRGRALEYSPLACNLYTGCSHGCVYCFGPLTLHMTREKFTAAIQPKKDALARLRKDAVKLRGDDREILLSFVTDVYQPIEMELGITRHAIEILRENGLRFTVLTKGGTRAARDFELLEGYGKARFGTTLGFMSQDKANVWEPYAATVQDRIRAIREAHGRGIPTWISLEPVIDPGEALAVIRELHTVVDHWKIGKVNHVKLPEPVDWLRFREDATALLDSLAASYYLKRSLTELF